MLLVEISFLVNVHVKMVFLCSKISFSCKMCSFLVDMSFVGELSPSYIFLCEKCVLLVKNTCFGKMLHF